MHAKLTWLDKMQFECINTNSSKIMIDATQEHGGNHIAPTPKELLLFAMIGCTAMDTKSILNKMRQNITKMEVSIDAVTTIEHPIHFKTAMLTFKLQGDASKEKIIKAVTKSLTQYCGVNYIVSKTCEITYEIFLNNEKIHNAKADFKS